MPSHIITSTDIYKYKVQCGSAIMLCVFTTCTTRTNAAHNTYLAGHERCFVCRSTFVSLAFCHTAEVRVLKWLREIMLLLWTTVCGVCWMLSASVDIMMKLDSLGINEPKQIIVQFPVSIDRRRWWWCRCCCCWIYRMRAHPLPVAVVAWARCWRVLSPICWCHWWYTRASCASSATFNLSTFVIVGCYVNLIFDRKFCTSDWSVCFCFSLRALRIIRLMIHVNGIFHFFFSVVIQWCYNRRQFKNIEWKRDLWDYTQFNLYSVVAVFFSSIFAGDTWPHVERYWIFSFGGFSKNNW